MINITFPDKCVSYETFVKDIAMSIVQMQSKMTKDVISQRKAFDRYGESNVRRWVKTGKLSIYSKRPGKIEYKIQDLERCSNHIQDYLEPVSNSNRPAKLSRYEISM